jgi:hypothetical protein
MVATYVDCPQKAYMGYTWTSVRSVHVVLIGISAAGWTSIRIIATLGYEYHLFVAVFTQLINGIMFINELMILLYFSTCIATFVWLSIGLSLLILISLAYMLKLNYL